MNDCLLLYLFSTEAQEASAILNRNRIRSRVTKPPAGLTGGSCAYALRFSPRDLRRIRALGFSGPVYCPGPDGMHRL